MNLSEHTQAVVDLLGTAGVLVGRGVKPQGGGWTGAPGQSAFVPYAIVWRLGAKDVLHRDLDGNFDERRPSHHIRTVGGSQTEADDLLDDCIASITGSPIVVPGFDNVHLIYDNSIGDGRDDDVQPALFYTGFYFRFWTQEQP